MKYWVYVLRSEKNGSLYKGITANIELRVKQHNDGQNYSTKLKGPWQLIYAEEAENRKDARNLEKFLKSGYSREIIKEIESALII